MIYTEEEFEKEIENLVLVDFYTTWCAPCMRLKEVIHKFEGIKVIEIDVDKNKYLGFKYAILSVPTLIIFDKNREIARKVSYQSLDEINEWIKNYK